MSVPRPPAPSRSFRLLSHAGDLDDLAARPSAFQALDARAKVLVTLGFVAVAASFGRNAALAPLPLLAYLAAAFALGEVPLAAVAARVALLSPFALLVGVADLVLHRAPAGTLWGVTFSEGAVSFASLLIRFVLCACAVFLLAATTRFSEVVHAFRGLGMPRALATQLLLSHRYAFVLAEEAGRILRAHALRAPGTGAPALPVAGRLVVQLLLRSLARAERVHAAMSCRGFDGDLTIRPTPPARVRDLAFVVACGLFFAAVRAVDVPTALGRALSP